MVTKILVVAGALVVVVVGGWWVLYELLGTGGYDWSKRRTRGGYSFGPWGQ